MSVRASSPIRASSMAWMWTRAKSGSRASVWKPKAKARARCNYRLRDWLVSRQRYWGCPIPMVHCAKCGIVPVTESDLPVKLPDDLRFRRAAAIRSIASDVEERRPARHAASAATRDTDTLDTFVDSSWYFARFCDTKRRTPVNRARPRITGCPSINISAASSTRSCICSMRASSRADCTSSATPTSTNRSPVCSRKAWSCHETYQGPERRNGSTPDEVEKRDGKAFLKGTNVPVDDRRRPRRCRSRRRT